MWGKYILCLVTLRWHTGFATLSFSNFQILRPKFDLNLPRGTESWYFPFKRNVFLVFALLSFESCSILFLVSQKQIECFQFWTNSQFYIWNLNQKSSNQILWILWRICYKFYNKKNFMILKDWGEFPNQKLYAIFLNQKLNRY